MTLKQAFDVTVKLTNACNTVRALLSVHAGSVDIDELNQLHLFAQSVISMCQREMLRRAVEGRVSV